MICMQKDDNKKNFENNSKLYSIKIDKNMIPKLIDYLKINNFQEIAKKSNYEYSRYYLKKSDSLLIVYNTGSVVLKNFDAKQLVDYLYQDNGIFIGCDEAGKGEKLGSIFCSCVCIDIKQMQYLISIGIKDSKELSDDKIIQLGKEIKKNSLFIKVVRITPEILLEKYMNEGIRKKNLNDLLTKAYERAIKECLHYLNKNHLIKEKIRIVVDQYDLKSCINLSEKFPLLVFLTNAERYPEVACASIIARYYYLNEKNKAEKWI